MADDLVVGTAPGPLSNTGLSDDTPYMVFANDGTYTVYEGADAVAGDTQLPAAQVRALAREHAAGRDYTSSHSKGKENGRFYRIVVSPISIDTYATRNVQSLQETGQPAPPPPGLAELAFPPPPSAADIIEDTDALCSQIDEHHPDLNDDRVHEMAGASRSGVLLRGRRMRPAHTRGMSGCRWIASVALCLVIGIAPCGAPSLGEWLSQMELGAYEAALREEGFGSPEEVLAAQLAADDMKELGLNMKERKKLLGVMKDARDAEASGSRGVEKPPPPLPPPPEEEDPLEWSRRVSPLDSSYCTFDTVDADSITAEVFNSKYRFRRPLRVRNMTHQLGWPANQLWRKSAFIEKYGGRKIVADTEYDKSSTVSKGGMTVNEYVSSFVERHQKLAQQAVGQAPQRGSRSSRRGAEHEVQQYAFDRQFIQKHAPELRNDFENIPLLYELGNSSEANAQPYLYLGPAESGLWFHRHGEAWNALVHGKKRWAVYPPGHANPKMATENGPNGEVIGVEKWMHTVYPRLQGTGLAPEECVQEAGDVFYLPGNWLHATNNLMDSIGVAVDHVETKVALAPSPIHDYHYGLGARLVDEEVTAYMTKQQYECGGGYDSAARCIAARFECGLLLTYRYVLNKPRTGQGGMGEETELATRGVAILEKAAAATASASDAVATRAQFVLGLTLANPGQIMQTQKGLQTIVQAIENGYTPIGFLELFFSIQAFNTRLAAAKRLKREEGIAADTQKVIDYSEQLLEDPESSHDMHIYNKHAIMLQLCETLLAAGELERGARSCEQATAINPLEESQYITLAKAYRQLGDAEQERGALQRALKMSPHSAAKMRLEQLERAARDEL